MSTISDADKHIRKLRKKIRQIERLEYLDRPLNEEEIVKVKLKEEIRSELAELLELADNNSVVAAPCETSPNLQENGLNDNAAIPIEPSQLKESDKNGTDLELMETSDHSSPSTNIPKCLPAENSSDSVEPMETSETSNSTSDIETQSASAKGVSTRGSNKRSSPTCEGTASPGRSPGDSVQKKKSKREAAALHQELPRNRTTKIIPKPWEETQLVSYWLEAHSDLVCCVDIDFHRVISGSRDTQVQVWDAKTGFAIQSLRGHTNSVTCASLLSMTESQDLLALLPGNGVNGCPDNAQLALTASLDCCLKLWNIETGENLGSIYTYSSITALCYLPVHHYCMIGSEGGKLEVFSFTEEQSHPLASVKAFEGPVSSIKVQGERIICSSLDGLISIWSLNNENGLELSRVFNSEKLVTESGQLVCKRPILSMGVSKNPVEGSIFFGDEGTNIKALDWKSGQVKKLRNHLHEYGLTNAIHVTESHLFSSSLNLDTGCSTINVRSLPDLSYQGTLDINGIGRIVCIAATETKEGLLKIAIGGSKLILLGTRILGSRRSPRKDRILKPLRVDGLSLPTEDSEDESDISSEDDGEETEMNNQPEEELAEESETKNSSWCNIL